MIALPSQLPHVVWQGDRLIPLYEGWVAESIAQAAHRDGLPRWESTVDVTRAILQFLQLDYSLPTILPDELLRIIRLSLNGIGHATIAQRVVLVPPRIAIYLPELALLAGYEMWFFPRLREQLHRALSYSVQAINLEGTRDCAKILQQAQKWSRSCGELEDQIVSFARTCLNEANAEAVELIVH